MCVCVCVCDVFIYLFICAEFENIFEDILQQHRFKDSGRCAFLVFVLCLPSPCNLNSNFHRRCHRRPRSQVHGGHANLSSGACLWMITLALSDAQGKEHLQHLVQTLTGRGKRPNSCRLFPLFVAAYFFVLSERPFLFSITKCVLLRGRVAEPVRAGAKPGWGIQLVPGHHQGAPPRPDRDPQRAAARVARYEWFSLGV